MAGRRDLDLTFDVEANCPRFETYVNNLRYELRDRTNRPAPLFDGLYVLRPYTTDPEQWLRLRMVHGDAAIVVMIRTDNLYMVGFRQEGQRARTWEFGRRPSSGRWHGLLGDDSVPLGFGGGYTNDGIGEIPTEPPPGQLMQPDLGLQQLIDAIHGLATYQGKEGKNPPPVEQWLRTIIITIIESIRSQKVCAFVARLVQKARSDWPDHSLICIIKNWEKISECVVLSANKPDDPELETLYKHLRRKGICGNTYQARQVVAILYRGQVPAAPPPRGRHKRSALVDDVAAGLSFVEVFAVVILDIDCASMGDLCGNIAVDDGLDPDVLFRRDRSAAQPVRPGGLAELTGPKRAIWGYDEIVFDLDLRQASRCADMSPDVQISKGQMVWNTHDRPVEGYDKAQEHVLRGKYGAVKICYAVITNAVVATVVVHLNVTNGGGGNDKNKAMYGSITAATSVFPAQKIKLFNRDSKHAVTMTAGQSIRLLRNVLVVQLGSSLQINADIWDRAFLPDMSPPDYQIAKGGVEFDATLAGTAFKSIAGTHGEATVRVTWSRT